MCENEVVHRFIKAGIRQFLKQDIKDYSVFIHDNIHTQQFVFIFVILMKA
jgi:hypothetical protein